jgi:hypothetical protein
MFIRYFLDKKQCMLYFQKSETSLCSTVIEFQFDLMSSNSNYSSANL